MSLSTTVFGCADYSFEIAGDAPLLAELEVALADLIVVDTTAAHEWLYSKVDDRHFSLQVDGAMVAQRVPTLSLVSYTVASLTRLVLDRDPDRLHLHAMAVLDRDSKFVAAGPSGSGKSTLCAAMVARGAAYVTDETVSLDPISRRASGFPKPLIIKRRSIDAVARSTGLRPPDIGAPVWAVPASSIGQLAPAGRHRVSTMVSYRYIDGARATVNPLHRATLTRELLTDSPDAIRFGPDSLGTIARLVASCRCLRAVTGDAEAVVDPLLRYHREMLTAGVTTRVPRSEPAGPGPRRSAETTSVVIDGRAVIYDSASLQIFELDEAATTWWRLLDGSSLSDLVNDVVDVTGSPRLETASIAERFVEEFATPGLIDTG